jgi:hypothetical protein
MFIRDAINRFFLLSILVFVTALAQAETPQDAIKRELPGWTLSGKVAQGDLNGDQRPDFAAVFYKPAQQQSEQRESLMVVFLADGQGGYSMQTKAPKADCVGCGGPKGSPDQPLGELEITPKGLLVITYQGGSREAWTDVMKWRWDSQSRQFLLVGETNTVVDTLAEEQDPETLDINYSTLKAEEIVGKKKKTCKVPAKYKGQSLAAFDYEESEAAEAIRESCK